MNRTGLVPISFLAIMVVSAGCASRGPSATPSPTARLQLASAAQGSGRSVGEPALYPARPIKYVLDTSLPDLGASAVVWRMRPHTPALDDVQRFAAALGLDGEPTRMPTGWEVRGSDTYLSVLVNDDAVSVSYSMGSLDTAGGSSGSGGSAGPPASGSGPATETEPGGVAPRPSSVPQLPAPVDVPSASDAERHARDLLDRFGVLAGQQWSAEVSDAGGVAVACPVESSCPPVDPQVSSRAVTFSPKIDSVPVAGGGWSVTIGERSRIESVYGDWAEATQVGPYPLLSTDAVFAGIQNGTAIYPGPQPMIAEGAPLPNGSDQPAVRAQEPLIVRVTGVSLALARWDGYLDDHTVLDIVPTYRFHSSIDGVPGADIEVLALDPRSITFTEPAPTTKPLPDQSTEPLPGQPAPSEDPIDSSTVSPTGP